MGAEASPTRDAGTREGRTDRCRGALDDERASCRRARTISEVRHARRAPRCRAAIPPRADRRMSDEPDPGAIDSSGSGRPGADARRAGRGGRRRNRHDCVSSRRGGPSEDAQRPLSLDDGQQRAHDRCAEDTGVPLAALSEGIRRSDFTSRRSTSSTLRPSRGTSHVTFAALAAELGITIEDLAASLLHGHSPSRRPMTVCARTTCRRCAPTCRRGPHSRAMSMRATRGAAGDAMRRLNGVGLQLSQRRCEVPFRAQRPERQGGRLPPAAAAAIPMISVR